MPVNYGTAFPGRPLPREQKRQARKPVLHAAELWDSLPRLSSPVIRKDRLESLPYMPVNCGTAFPGCPLPREQEGQARKPVLHSRDVGQPFQAVQSGGL